MSIKHIKFNILSTMLPFEIPSRFSKVYFVSDKVFVLEKKY